MDRHNSLTIHNKKRLCGILSVIEFAKSSKLNNSNYWQINYILFTNYSHTDKKNDNFRQQMIIKENPSEAKEWIKKMINKSVIYIDIKYLCYKEEDL